MAWSCFDFWQFELSLTPPYSNEHNIGCLSQVDSAKRRVNQLSNMIQVELRNNPAGIRVALQHFCMRQNSSHILIADLRYILRCVVLLNSLQVLKGRQCDT